VIAASASVNFGKSLMAMGGASAGDRSGACCWNRFAIIGRAYWELWLPKQEARACESCSR
jgi:hypothetical protein